MNALEAARLAFIQIRTEKMKSFFSLLGVLIGVMFLITVVSVVEGMDRYIREDFSAQLFGVNTVTLQRAPTVNIDPSSGEWRAHRRRPEITFEDAEALRRKLTVPARVLVESEVTEEVTAEGGLSASNVRVKAASPEIFVVRNHTVEAGRAFTSREADRGVPVILLGSETAEALFPGLDPLGRSVRIRGFPYRVIGILRERGSLFGRSLDGVAIAPVHSPIESATPPHGGVGQVVVQVLDPADVVHARAEVEEIMRTRRRLRPGAASDFSVETADQALSFWNRISSVLFLALPGLVGISLIVGGIVMMNIMLVSVLERTREIGIRKALGARRRDILAQIMIECVALSLGGALIGVGVGVGLASLLDAVSPIPAAAAPRWITLSLVLGVGVGVAAGVIPASRASRLDPVDALRHEG